MTQLSGGPGAWSVPTLSAGPVLPSERPRDQPATDLAGPLDDAVVHVGVRAGDPVVSRWASTVVRPHWSEGVA